MITTKEGQNEVLETTLHLMAKRSLYHRWLCESFEPHIGRRLLEVGCGIGSVTHLLGNIPYIHSIDISQDNIDIMKRELGSRDNMFIERLDIFDAGFIELSRLDFDTILCVSVLEHIEDDIEVLKRFFDVIRPGGRVILFVPALQILFSRMDSELGHFRRYEKKELEEKVTRAGFTIIKTAYFNLPGILGWIVNGKILRRKILSDSQLGLFDKMVPVIRRFERIFSPPLGACLLCVAQRKVNIKNV